MKRNTAKHKVKLNYEFLEHRLSTAFLSFQLRNLAMKQLHPHFFAKKASGETLKTT